MLYIKCKVTSLENIVAFQKLYKYLLEDNYLVYQMKDFEDSMDLNERLQERALKLYNEYFPLNAQTFMNDFFEYESGSNELKEESITSLFSYLDVDFEVDFTNLVIEKEILCVKFSTGNYPYGGMLQFLMVLKAFEFEPLECFNGFDVYEFEWTSKYEHEAKVLIDKTKSYLKSSKN